MKWSSTFYYTWPSTQAKQMEHVGVQGIFDNNSDEGMK